MGAPPAEDRPGQGGAGCLESAQKPSKRRNTVHATPVAPVMTNTTWPPVPINYSPQPMLVPLYSPLWHWTQSAAVALNSAGLAPAVIPLASPGRSSPHGRPRTGSRAASPHNRGRRRERSNDRWPAPDRAGPVGDPHRVRRGRLPAESSPSRPAMPPAPMTTSKVEPFPPWPDRPVPPVEPTPPTDQPLSLPTTPRQRPRKFSAGPVTSTTTTSPSSPHEPRPPPSPRSARSESTGRWPGPRPITRVVQCPYETGMAFPRRRMPYALGGDPLDKVPVLNTHLSPDEEKKLSGDMRELYDRLLPSTDSEQRRAKLLRKLERILQEEWPGRDIAVRVFGSSGNLLCTSDSDG